MPPAVISPSVSQTHSGCDSRGCIVYPQTRGIQPRSRNKGKRLERDLGIAGRNFSAQLKLLGENLERRHDPNCSPS